MEDTDMLRMPNEPGLWLDGTQRLRLVVAAEGNEDKYWDDDEEPEDGELRWMMIRGEFGDDWQLGTLRPLTRANAVPEGPFTAIHVIGGAAMTLPSDEDAQIAAEVICETLFDMPLHDADSERAYWCSSAALRALSAIRDAHA